MPPTLQPKPAPLLDRLSAYAEFSSCKSRAWPAPTIGSHDNPGPWVMPSIGGPELLASLCDLVPHVVGINARKKVEWIEASWRVAAVHYEKAIRRFSIGPGIGGAMSQPANPYPVYFFACPAIASMVDIALPYPAGVALIFRKRLAENVNHSLRKVFAGYASSGASAFTRAERNAIVGFGHRSLPRSVDKSAPRCFEHPALAQLTAAVE